MSFNSLSECCGKQLETWQLPSCWAMRSLHALSVAFLPWAQTSPCLRSEARSFWWPSAVKRSKLLQHLGMNFWIPTTPLPRKPGTIVAFHPNRFSDSQRLCEGVELLEGIRKLAVHEVQLRHRLPVPGSKSLIDQGWLMYSQHMLNVSLPVPCQLRPKNDGKGNTSSKCLETIVMLNFRRIPQVF